MADPTPAHGTPPPEDPLLTGGPGAEPEPPQPERPGPKLVPIKLHGREVQLPEDVVPLWQEREQTLSRVGQELGELRQWRKQVEAQLRPPAPPEEPDINTLWFENPKAAYQKIKQEVRQEIVGEYRQDQALRAFWDGFDRVNDDLREDRWLAEAMMREHLEELADLPPRKAQERLGEITREQILKFTKKAPRAESPARQLVEPASGDRPERPARDDADEPKSISQLIAERHARRMKGAKGA